MIHQRIRYGLNELFYFILNPKASFKQILYQRKIKPVLTTNMELKNKYPGKRCFIVGNGSSLNKMDLKKLKYEYTFVVNNIFLHKDFKYINPKYYVNIEPITSFGPHHIPPDKFYYPENYFSSVAKHINNTNTTMLLNIANKEYFDSHHYFKNKKIYYLKQGISLLVTDKFGYESDITKNISFCDSVIPAAICSAVYMGFKTIYLIGCDEDYFFNSKGFHFYPTLDEKAVDLPLVKIKTKSMEKMAYDYSQTFKRWRILITYFEKKGVKIFNAGVGGVLDVCPRVNYKKLF